MDSMTCNCDRIVTQIYQLVSNDPFEGKPITEEFPNEDRKKSFLQLWRKYFINHKMEAYGSRFPKLYTSERVSKVFKELDWVRFQRKVEVARFGQKHLRRYKEGYWLENMAEVKVFNNMIAEDFRLSAISMYEEILSCCCQHGDSGFIFRSNAENLRDNLHFYVQILKYTLPEQLSFKQPSISIEDVDFFFVKSEPFLDQQWSRVLGGVRQTVLQRLLEQKFQFESLTEDQICVQERMLQMHKNMERIAKISAANRKQPTPPSSPKKPSIPSPKQFPQYPELKQYTPYELLPTEKRKMIQKDLNKDEYQKFRDTLRQKRLERKAEKRRLLKKQQIEGMPDQDYEEFETDLMLGTMKTYLVSYRKGVKTTKLIKEEQLFKQQDEIFEEEE